MAQITWRNVDAPNFSGALDGVKTAAYLFGNAGNTLSQGLGDFRQFQQDQAASGAMQNAVKITDPAQYQQALADGSLFNGIDTSQLNARTVNALGNRTGDLINNALNQEKLDYSNYTFGREKNQNAALDAAAPLLAQISNAFASGDTRTGQALMAQNQDVLGTLTPDQIASINRGNLANTGANLQNQTAAFGLQRSQQDYAQDRQVQAALGQVMQNSLTGADVLANASALMQGMDPNAQAAFMGRVNQLMPGTFGPQNGGAMPGGGSVAPNNIMTGGAALPAQYKTIGQVVDGKSDLLGYNPAGTAVGTYQMTADTWKDYAPKALGDNWRDADVRDQGVQDKVAAALWNDIKNDPTQIKNRWASFTPAEAQAAVGKSWDQVRGQIAQKESGANIAQMQADTLNANNVTTATANALQARSAIDNNGINAQEWLQATNNGIGLDSRTVANQMNSGDSALKGLGVDWIQNRIKDIQSQNKNINPAQAAILLKQAIDPRSDHALVRGFQGIVGALGGTTPSDTGATFDSEVANTLATKANAGEITTQALANVMQGQQLQQLQAASQQQNQALQVYQAALSRRNAGQNIPVSQLMVYKQNYDLASSRVNQLQASLRSDPNNLPPDWGKKGNANPTANEAPVGGVGKPVDTVNDQTKRDAVNEAMNRGLQDLQRNSSIYYR